MDVVATAVTLVGIVLAIGAGVFARWIAPGEPARPVRRVLGIGLRLGAAMVVVGSLGDVVVTLDRVLRGGLDARFLIDYLSATRHGRSVLAGSFLTLALVAWGTRRRRARGADRLVHGTLAVGLLATSAWVSHSGAMGVLPFLGDLGHLMGASAWAGALAYLSWAPVWRDPGLPAMVERVSSLGLAGVALLVGSGTYMATLHLYGLEALTTTASGVSLVVKLALVALIVGLAGVNRWWLVPLLARRRHRPLRIAVRVESLLLALVLVATAVLSTREPAHDGPPHPAHPSHAALGGAVVTAVAAGRRP
jgi:putative copper export protein